MKVAYFTNKYPYVRHTFIRREVVGVEGDGVEVERFTIRRADDVVDPADVAEQKRTHVLLEGGVVGLALSLLATAVRQPVRFLRAWWRATRMGIRSDRGLLRHWAYLAEACLLVPRMRERGVTHLHVHFGTNCAAVARFCRLLGGPTYSLTIHGSEEWDRPEALSLREKYENAAFVVSVSEYGRCQVFRWTAYSFWPRVHVVRCGVDRMFLDGELQPLPAEPRIVVVAALVEGKGHLRLLEALAPLAKEGRDFEVLLVGDGPLRPVIEAETTRLGLTGRVKILGWQSNEQVRQHILASRVMALPSFAENLPVVFMEALALGRPVIATQLAGIPELIEPGVNGWLVPPGAIEPLTRALREALEAPTERLAAMGRAGRTRVAELHDANREAGKMAELFRALASSPPA